MGRDAGKSGGLVGARRHDRAMTSDPTDQSEEPILREQRAELWRLAHRNKLLIYVNISRDDAMLLDEARALRDDLTKCIDAARLLLEP